MKSGPTLAEATRMPRLAKAASSPVATVVLPTPEWVPAMTRRGPSEGIRHPATLHESLRLTRIDRSLACRVRNDPTIRHHVVMRIVLLLPSATEILYALNLGEELVGVTTNATGPRRPVAGVSSPTRRFRGRRRVRAQDCPPDADEQRH